MAGGSTVFTLILLMITKKEVYLRILTVVPAINRVSFGARMPTAHKPKWIPPEWWWHHHQAYHLTPRQRCTACTYQGPYTSPYAHTPRVAAPLCSQHVLYLMKVQQLCSANEPHILVRLYMPCHDSARLPAGPSKREEFFFSIKASRDRSRSISSRTACLTE